MPSSEDIRKWFNLQPNTLEGGYFTGTYESSIKLPDADLPGFPATDNSRPLCGAIYYFLDANGFSALHKVTGDMLYHFYSGDPVQMLLLYPPEFSSRTEVCIFSNDVSAGTSPMKVIPGGTWLGSRLTPGGNYALMGVTMAPGFHPNDYSIGERNELIKEYPDQKDMIESLTQLKRQ
jgi:predicted cupin superfamily sugar epimerase